MDFAFGKIHFLQFSGIIHASDFYLLVTMYGLIAFATAYIGIL